MLFVQNFFVLLNSTRILKETPEKFEEFIRMALEMYNNTLEEQIFLQDQGVSFAYTDTLDFQSRRDLINTILEWREEHPRPTLF